MSTRTNDKLIRKYLATHAEDSAQLGASIGERFAQVVVFPAYGEDEILDRAIASIPCASDRTTLAVVVINQHADSADSVKATNQATFARLQERYGERRRLGRDALLCQTPFGALALARVTLPHGQGVGLARKHGADLAFGAWAAGCIDSSWIHCTDADVQLPQNYFCAPHASASVALHRFRHQTTDAATQPYMRIYDLWLRLHVLGLHWAGSPYGFHSIGSTITVNARSYAAVRGFPRRKAAEDFYFLNKLAKLGPVISAQSAPLRIEARVSERVPFGTGRAMGLAQREGIDALPRFYDPLVYVYLKACLQSMNDSCTSGIFERRSIHRALAAQGLAKGPLDLAPLDAAMNALGIDAAINKLLGSSADHEQRRRAVHCWFDAFRTMKFIHHLRDNGVASVALDSALRTGQFLLEQHSPCVRDDICVIRGTCADC